MKYFYTVTYSFDSDRHMVGMFDSYDRAWESMLKDANREEQIDSIENGWGNVYLEINKEIGEIVLCVEFNNGYTDYTKWLLFEYNE